MKSMLLSLLLLPALAFAQNPTFVQVDAMPYSAALSISGGTAPFKLWRSEPGTYVLVADNIYNVFGVDYIITGLQPNSFDIYTMTGAGVNSAASGYIIHVATPAAPTFFDVDLSHWAYTQIEHIAAKGITSGCGGGNYCPDASITRAQMAVFISRVIDDYEAQLDAVRARLDALEAQ